MTTGHSDMVIWSCSKWGWTTLDICQYVLNCIDIYIYIIYIYTYITVHYIDSQVPRYSIYLSFAEDGHSHPGKALQCFVDGELRDASFSWKW